MANEIEVEAVYHDELTERVGLYVLALIELARQLQAEDEAAAGSSSGLAATSEGGDEHQESSDVG